MVCWAEKRSSNSGMEEIYMPKHCQKWLILQQTVQKAAFSPTLSCVTNMNDDDTQSERVSTTAVIVMQKHICSAPFNRL